MVTAGNQRRTCGRREAEACASALNVLGELVAHDLRALADNRPDFPFLGVWGPRQVGHTAPPAFQVILEGADDGEPRSAPRLPQEQGAAGLSDRTH